MAKTIITFLSILVYSGYLSAQIINVPSDQPTIQGAINEASEGDTVLVAHGTYYENISIKQKAIILASLFLIDGDTSHIQKTIIDGSHAIDSDSASVITIDNVPNSNSVLIGFTITGGAGSRVTYGGSDAIAGGGIFIRDCGATIKSNIIEDNILQSTWVAAGGLAIIPGVADTVILSENLIRRNEVISDWITAAGGIWIMGAPNSTIHIHNNVISENKVSVEAEYKAIGGGISIETKYSYASDIQVYNNIINKNELHCKSSHGGGIYIVYSPDTQASFTSTQVKIYNNLILDNYSEDVGGGIGVWNMDYYGTGVNTPVDPLIMNNTVVDNLAAGGSGIFNYDARTLLANNILWNDISIEGSLELYNSDINYPDWGWNKDRNDGILISLFNDIQGSREGMGNIDGEPIFEPDSYSLTKGSPGIGHGIDSIEISGDLFLAPVTDFYGNPRPNPADYRVDMGAVESPHEGFIYLPDSAFLDALIDEGVDANMDSLISYSEAEMATNLSVIGEEISDMKGIEYFINLETLRCNNNLITSLDLSKNTKLKELNCGCINAPGPGCRGSLSELDITGCAELIVLYCMGNKLSRLNVSNNTLLSELHCQGNYLSTLDLSNNGMLLELHCSYNQLISLDLTNNPLLTLLNCSGNQLSNLDLSNNKKIGDPPADSGYDLELGDMPTLYEVCVWTEPFPPNGVKVHSENSPNAYFKVDCNTGIQDMKRSQLSINPNPAHDNFNIQCGRSDIWFVEIYSPNGRLMYADSFNEYSHQIDLRMFDNGIYFVRVHSRNSVRTGKLIKW